jgi:two-component system NtrC family sensor kinase
VRRPRIASRKPPTTRQRKTENPKRSTTSNAAGRTTSSVADLQERLERQAREIEDAREERAAISEVLRVISSSPGDSQPVFAAMLENAVRICGAKFGNLWLYDGESFRIDATYGAPPAYVEYLRRAGPFRADARVGIGRLAQTRQTYQVADVAAQPTHNDKLRVATIDLAGARTVLGVPMLKDGKVVGSIVIYRREVQPFTEKQVALVENFAAQAVIAIENTRLLNELRQRTADLTESLEQQTATAEVLGVISRSKFELQPILQSVVDTAMRLCRADQAIIYRPQSGTYRFAAGHSTVPEYLEIEKQTTIVPGHGTVVGRAALTRQVARVDDPLADPLYEKKDDARVGGVRSMIGVPLMRDGEPIGVIGLARNRVEPFTDHEIELVTTFADQAVIAIENVRLFEAEQQRTRELTESLQQQSATADVLKVISRSPFDLQTVLDTLVESAARLCDADSAAIHRPDGNSYPYVASYGYSREYHEYMRERTMIPGRGTVLGRAVTECKPTQVNDVAADPEYTLREGQRLGGFRTVLGIPLLRESAPIGVIVLTRKAVRPFTDKQIELATTFADQAAIAIENVRLFEAEQQRTQELARSLEELRTVQDRLVQTQKLASLGQLTAGIAHEIKNPLNFVNNFSDVSVELIDELREALADAALGKGQTEITELTDTLRSNLDKIMQHGKRADSIVKNMLLHSREGTGERRPVDINGLVEEAVNLAYHGARAEKKGFNITLERALDPTAGQVDCFPQEIIRVLLNLIANGFYAATQRKGLTENGDYEPTLAAATRNLGDRVEIRIWDNGAGIPPEVKEKMFNPFFTTKPAGEGTGLGLSISHDVIVKQHSGIIEVESRPGEFTEFRIVLPRAAATLAKSGGTA